jgi:hypothetical protein
MFLGSIIKPTNQPQENKPMTATHVGGMMELSSDFCTLRMPSDVELWEPWYESMYIRGNFWK